MKLIAERVDKWYYSGGYVGHLWKDLGGKYVGEWKNGKEHGKGIRFYRAGLMNNDKGKYEGRTLQYPIESERFQMDTCQRIQNVHD